MKYNVMRFHRNSKIPNKMIKEDLTLTEAQEYCEGKNTEESEKEFFLGYIATSRYEE